MLRQWVEKYKPEDTKMQQQALEHNAVQTTDSHNVWQSVMFKTVLVKSVGIKKKKKLQSL